MKTSLTSGSLLTFDALTKEKMKHVNFSLSVMHFNCGSFRPIMFRPAATRSKSNLRSIPEA